MSDLSTLVTECGRTAPVMMSRDRAIARCPSRHSRTSRLQDCNAITTWDGVLSDVACTPRRVNIGTRLTQGPHVTVVSLYMVYSATMTSALGLFQKLSSGGGAQTLFCPVGGGEGVLLTMCPRGGGGWRGNLSWGSRHI